MSKYIKKEIKKSKKQWVSCRSDGGFWCQISFILGKFIDDDIVENTLETMTYLQVKEQHHTTTRYDFQSKNKWKDVAIWGTYKLNGVEVSTNKLYIPRVKLQYDKKDIETFLKKIYGKSFIIDDMQVYYR